MTEPKLTATLLANGPYVREEAPFALLDLVGPDAGAFLQRLCTQDVLGLGAGEVAPAAFLDAKGKVRFTVLVWPCGEGYRLETHQEQADGLYELLERYHFSEQLTIERAAAGGCTEQVSLADAPAQRIDETDAGFQLVYARRGVQFVRSYGAGPAADGAPLPHALAEALRMAAGLVRVGVETEASTLALEADLDDHCSTRKGCYTGQEIVARIHTYGHVNRKLCLLQLDGGERIEAPTTLLELEDELPVGRVMHAVSVPGHDLRVGLGYLPEDFQALGSKLKLEDGAAVEVSGFA
jgi:folate-binding protein YgfZ